MWGPNDSLTMINQLHLSSLIGLRSRALANERACFGSSHEGEIASVAPTVLICSTVVVLITANARKTHRLA